MTSFSSQTTTVVWREWSGLQDYVYMGVEIGLLAAGLIFGPTILS